MNLNERPPSQNVEQEQSNVENVEGSELEVQSSKYGERYDTWKELLSEREDPVPTAEFVNMVNELGPDADPDMSIQMYADWKEQSLGQPFESLEPVFKNERLDAQREQLTDEQIETIEKLEGAERAAKLSVLGHQKEARSKLLELHRENDIETHHEIPRSVELGDSSENRSFAFYLPLEDWETRLTDLPSESRAQIAEIFDLGEDASNEDIVTHVREYCMDRMTEVIVDELGGSPHENSSYQLTGTISTEVGEQVAQERMAGVIDELNGMFNIVPATAWKDMRLTIGLDDQEVRMVKIDEGDTAEAVMGVVYPGRSVVTANNANSEAVFLEHAEAMHESPGQIMLVTNNRERAGEPASIVENLKKKTAFYAESLEVKPYSGEELTIGKEKGDFPANMEEVRFLQQANIDQYIPPSAMEKIIQDHSMELEAAGMIEVNLGQETQVSRVSVGLLGAEVGKVDMTGYSELSNILGGELGIDAFDIASEYFTQLTTEVKKYGVLVDNLTGDAVQTVTLSPEQLVELGIDADSEYMEYSPQERAVMCSQIAEEVWQKTMAEATAELPEEFQGERLELLANAIGKEQLLSTVKQEIEDFRATGEEDLPNWLRAKAIAVATLSMQKELGIKSITQQEGSAYLKLKVGESGISEQVTTPSFLEAEDAMEGVSRVSGKPTISLETYNSLPGEQRALFVEVEDDLGNKVFVLEF